MLSILHGHNLLGMGRMGLVDTCNKSAQLCFEHAALQGSIHDMQQSFVTVIFSVKGCSKETSQSSNGATYVCGIGEDEEEKGETLSDIDMDMSEFIVDDEDEVRQKEQIWDTMNHDYLEKQELKRLQLEEAHQVCPHQPTQASCATTNCHGIHHCAVFAQTH